MSAKKAILGLMLGCTILGFSSTADAATWHVQLGAGQGTYYYQSFHGTGHVSGRTPNFRIMVYDSTGFMVASTVVPPGQGAGTSVTWPVRTPGTHRIVIQNLNDHTSASHFWSNAN